MKMALEAKAALRGALEDMGIRASCGITMCEGKHAVKVNVATAEELEQVPASIGGVVVVKEIVGQISPRRRASGRSITRQVNLPE